MERQWENDYVVLDHSRCSNFYGTFKCLFGVSAEASVFISPTTTSTNFTSYSRRNAPLWERLPIGDQSKSRSRVWRYRTVEYARQNVGYFSIQWRIRYARQIRPDKGDAEAVNWEEKVFIFSGMEATRRCCEPFLSILISAKQISHFLRVRVSASL